MTTGLGASLAGALFAAGLARGQGVGSSAADPAVPSAVVTTVDPCVPLDLAHFRRLLSIELGTSIDYQAEAPREEGQTWVHLACAPGGVALQLQDGVTHKSMMRVLDTDSVAPAERTRLLALAVAEFVVASWVELRAVPQPSLRALGAPAAPPPEVQRVVDDVVDRKLPPGPPPSAATSSWEIALGPGLEWFASHTGVFATLSLRLVQASPPLAFLIGGDVGLMNVPVVRLESEVAQVDVLRASALAALLFGREVGPVSLWGGAGLRLGIVRLVSESNLSGLRDLEFSRVSGGPLLLGRVGHRFSENFGVGFELELGVVTLPVQATVLAGGMELKDPQLEFSQVWLAGGLRAALLF